MRTFILTLYLVLIHLFVQADEGMWLLPLIEDLNIRDMQDMGLQLDADQIYSLNQSSLKDAVGALDYGSCTAELVSPDGLLLTNHHCGFSEIQSHSTVEHDYLSEGFWAATRAEELQNPGKSISFLVRMEDVTGQIFNEVDPGMGEQERQNTIDNITNSLITDATEGTHYEGFVSSFYEGNSYFLILVETYRDIRLVGAPPSSIGKFGDETDNWVWPRHTGDFCLFRVYTGPDGKPADYHPDNIPYQPRHYLPVSLSGIQENDFSMVLGFPGSTSRYMTAAEIRERMSITNTVRTQVGDIALDLMKQDMQSSDEIRIKYSDKYAAYSNYRKFSRGENKSIIENGILEKQELVEERFRQWVDGDKSRADKYGEVLDRIEDIIEERREYAWPKAYMEELFLLYKPIEHIDFAASAFTLYLSLLGDEEYGSRQEEITSDLREEAEAFFKNYHPETDKKISIALLEHYADQVDPVYYPLFIQEVETKYKGNYRKYVDRVFRKSVFVDRARFFDFLEDPSLKVFEKDPVFDATRMLFMKYFQVDDYYQDSQDEFSSNRRLYISGIKEMFDKKVFYPDANSSLRLSYGNVGDYHPRDGVRYEYYTTLAGVMEKEDPDNPEFIVPEKLKQLYASKDYGAYGNGEVMPVCFITDNDITGGNSGSPVLDETGSLIGIAFDGNWEAMSSDVAYEPGLQKCICVDIRYVLFIIDKFAGATHLIDEMTIVE